MIFHETPIQNAYVVDMEPIMDERGYFALAWSQKDFEAHGLAARVVQTNVARNRKRGTLRGMHYQVEPFLETKYVRCTSGAIYDVVIDLRPESPTYQQWIGVELSAENGCMLYVPERCAHGYQTLVDDTEVIYQVSQCYAPHAARGIHYADPAFEITWPLEVTVISTKDQGWSFYDQHVADSLIELSLS